MLAVDTDGDSRPDVVIAVRGTAGTTLEAVVQAGPDGTRISLVAVASQPPGEPAAPGQDSFDEVIITYAREDGSTDWDAAAAAVLAAFEETGTWFLPPRVVEPVDALDRKRGFRTLRAGA